MPKKTPDDIKNLLDKEWGEYRSKKDEMLALVSQIRSDFWRDNKALFRRVERLEITYDLMLEEGLDPLIAYLSAM